MSKSPSTPVKNNSNNTSNRKVRENGKNNLSECQIAKNFITWYKHMIDNETQNLGLYMSDNAILEWFGKTIKTRKKVSAFLKHDMQCSRHNFVSIKTIDKIQDRLERSRRCVFCKYMF
jgi:hypothetical protein